MLLVIAASGCAIAPDPPQGTREKRSEAPPPEVDPSRAYVPLSRIEPVVEPPIRPASIKPLSERAAGQIEIARKLVDQQRYTEAAIKLERALRYDPDHPEIHRALSTLHWQAGNAERARIHAARALEADADDATAHYVLGRCLASSGDNRAAIRAYRTACLCSDFDSHAETAASCHYHLAQALEAEGYLEAALSQYAAFEQRALVSEAGDGQRDLVDLLRSKRRPMAEARSRLLERLQRHAEAAEALSPLLSDSPDAPLASRCARLWLRAGRFAEALEAVRAIQSDDEEVVRLLLEVHEQGGHPERIIPELRARLVHRPDEPQPVLNLADALIRLDRPDEAKKELLRFLGGHPDADVIRTRLVDLLLVESGWTEALALCSEGIKRQPARAARFEAKIVELAANRQAVSRLLAPQAVGSEDDHASLYLRGMLAAAAGRLDQAETLLSRSHARTRAFVPARVALARVYMRAYRYDEALEVAARSNEDEPEDARLERVLGEVHERLDNLDQAELHFKAAIQLDRADRASMLALAKVLRRSGEANRAQLQLRALLDQDPGCEEAREMLAFAYLEEGKVDAAIEQYEELRKRSNTPTTRARCDAMLAQLRLPHPDSEAYRKVLIESMKNSESDANTWLALGDSYGPFEQDQAREAYLNALTIDPDREDARVGLVHAERRLLNFESAMMHLKDLLPRRPNRHLWRLLLVDFYFVVQDDASGLVLARREEAREDLDDATRRAYRGRVVRALRKLGRDEEAVRQLEAWADADPEDHEASIQLADEYIARKQASKAVVILESLHQADVENSSSLARLIRALLAADRHDRACQHALDWVYRDPESDLALSLLATVLADADRLGDALELINSRLLHTEHREHFQDLAGDLLRQAERYDECVDLTERLTDEVITLMRQMSEAPRPKPVEPADREQLTRRPNEPFSWDSLDGRLENLRRRLGFELILAKKYREAEERLTAWLNASGDQWRRHRFDYLRLLALCHQSQGDDARAAETLELALSLEPDNVGLNNDVAYGWIDRGIRLDEAERMIRFALSSVPTEGAYLDTYGWLLYKKGLFPEARKWLARAARARDTDDGVILDHLGDTCWRLRETEEAIRYWTSAIAAMAAGERGEDELSGDERRVRDRTPQKVDAAGAGQAPKVAPVAGIAEDEEARDAGVP